MAKMPTPEEIGKYAPVPFDPEIEHERGMQSAEYRAAYLAMEDEFSTLDALLIARKEAGLTQAQVAERMGVKQSALGRIEGSLGSRKHSPSLATLRKYAAACGKKLVIQMV